MDCKKLKRKVSRNIKFDESEKRFLEGLIIMYQLSGIMFEDWSEVADALTKVD